MSSDLFRVRIGLQRKTGAHQEEVARVGEAMEVLRIQEVAIMKMLGEGLPSGKLLSALLCT